MGHSLMVVTAEVAAVIIEHLLHARLSPSSLSHSIYTDPLLQARKSRLRTIMSLVSQLTNVWTKIQVQAVQFQSSLCPVLATSPDTPTTPESHSPFLVLFQFCPIMKLQASIWSKSVVNAFLSFAKLLCNTWGASSAPSPL